MPMHTRTRRCGRGLLALATTLSLLIACGDDDPDAGGTPAATASAQPLLVKGDGYSIRMPGRPERSSQETAAAGKKIGVEIYLYDTDMEAYTFTRAVYPDEVTPDLQRTLAASADSAKGTLEVTSTFDYHGQKAAEGTIVDAEANGQPVIIFSRYVLVDQVLFGMVYLAKGRLPEEPPPAFLAFANSLQFT